MSTEKPSSKSLMAILAPAFLLRRLNETDIGQSIETDNAQEGILINPNFQYVRQGRRFGPPLYYFAAPQDIGYLDSLAKHATYYGSIQRIARLDTCGHHGILLRNEDEIHHTATHNPEKLALWHMPTLPLLNGYSVYRDPANPNNMCAHRNMGALKDTFKGVSYWSSTSNLVIESEMYIVDLGRSDDIDCGLKHIHQLSSRPVRAKLRPEI